MRSANMIAFILPDFLPNFLWLLVALLFLTLHNLTFDEDYICAWCNKRLDAKTVR